MQSIDDKTYKRYFPLCGESSKWSGKNKTLAKKLEKQETITDHGRRKIGEAREGSRWDAPEPPAVTEDQIAAIADLLRGYESAHTNLFATSQSVKKTYTRTYFDAKTDAGRERRTAWMVDRLDKNLKPM